MNFDLIAFLNRPLFPKLLCAFWGILLLLVLMQVKSTLWPAERQNLTILSTNQEEPNVQQSLAMPLFGHYAAVNPHGGVMKQSTLDVTIIGIMYSSKASHSQVLIRLNNGEEHSYLVGDELPGGAIIKRIKADSVVILFQGTLEVLNLPKTKLQFDEPAKPLFKE
ncbi:MAG: hypothetical protein A3F46_06010 [Legionellales bacterium RIFCSPHIGHO2_12_FULL_42_9]|nr:MAG: hypothetical protein A3F46_06010 [Legionellales bacterium RIFCSPHIGHO2_12_FULL_42_9]